MADQEALRCSTRARIVSSSFNYWRMATQDDHGSDVKEVRIELRIEAAGSVGFLLIMAPDGCFTADNWYITKSEALEDAEAIFGVPPAAWTS